MIPHQVSGRALCFIFCEALLEVLKDVFPKAAKSLRDNTWSTSLYGRSLLKPANDIDLNREISEAGNRAETEELGPVSIPPSS